MKNTDDPFQKPREESGVLPCEFQGEKIPMILRHADVQNAAKDWDTFSSDAPFRVPIPSEENLRTMRQLPIETNPPEHTEYRAIVEPFFQTRPGIRKSLRKSKRSLAACSRKRLRRSPSKWLASLRFPCNATP